MATTMIRKRRNCAKSSQIRPRKAVPTTTMIVISAFCIFCWSPYAPCATHAWIIQTAFASPSSSTARSSDSLCSYSQKNNQCPSGRRCLLAHSLQEGGSSSATTSMSLPSTKATSGLSLSRPQTKRSFRNTAYGTDEESFGLRFSPQRRKQQQHKRQHKFRVFCDLDGVLADFCTGVRQLYDEEELARFEQGNASVNVDSLDRGSMWQRVASADAFFANLEWMPSGKSLWQVVKQLEPAILTGVPIHPASSRQQKVEWCRRELGMPAIEHTDKAGLLFRHVPTISNNNTPLSTEEVGLLQPPSGSNNHNVDDDEEHDHAVCHVITCWSNNKHYESGPGAVLIDDRIELKEAWEAKGGIFVHHNGNAEETISQLEKHGIIQEFLCP